MTAVLVMEDVAVAYGAGRRKRVVASGVSFEVAAGETLALVGESGSGKSTIGRAAVRLLRPCAGAVRWFGDDVTAESPRALRSRRPSFQYVPQDPGASFDPYRSVGWSIGLNIPATQLTGEADSRTMMKDLLRSVGLPASALDGRPGQFSGGQRQRLAIARALASKPALIVCDEITSALDVSTQASILELLRKVQRSTSTALVFITHDLAVVRQIADRIMVMNEGRIVEHGTVANVLDRPSDPYTVRLIDSVPDLSGRRRYRK